MKDFTVRLGVLYVDLFIGQAQSLKDKRMVLKSLKDKVHSKFNISVAELDRQDKWQTATLGFAMISNDSRYINKELENILSLIRGYYAADISDHRIELF